MAEERKIFKCLVPSGPAAGTGTIERMNVAIPESKLILFENIHMNLGRELNVNANETISESRYVH